MGSVFQTIISSTRSCNQNTGPMIDSKRLKFVDMASDSRGSREDSNVVWLWSVLDAGGAERLDWAIKEEAKETTQVEE
jgi:hypothetical protein